MAEIVQSRWQNWIIAQSEFRDLNKDPGWGSSGKEGIMSAVRVGVIGAGSFGEVHIATYQTFPDVEVVAVCDPDEPRLAEMAQKYSIPSVYTRFEDLCERDDLDAVSVVTPETGHLEPTVCALKHHKHVLLEKPIASSLEDSRQILSAAQSSSRVLLVGQILRFENKYGTVKRLIEEGRLGKIVSIHARRNRPRKLYRVWGNRVNLMLENSINDVDIILWYVQDRVNQVRAFARNTQGGLYPDINWGFLEFENGAVACLETNWTLPDESGVMTDDAMYVIGSEGTARIEFVPSGLAIWSSSGQEIMNTSYDALLPYGIEGAIRQEVGYFLKCVKTGCEPTVILPEEAAEALRVTLALVESAESRADVRLPLEKRP
jgi:UDP-N-acetylglucosamine 3-dehydrogenase